MFAIAGGIILAVFLWMIFCLVMQFIFFVMAESMDRPRKYHIPTPPPVESDLMKKAKEMGGDK